MENKKFISNSLIDYNQCKSMIEKVMLNERTGDEFKQLKHSYYELLYGVVGDDAKADLHKEM